MRTEDERQTPVDGRMTPYTAFFVFTLGVLASNFVFNTIMMKKPVSGEPVNGADWFKGGLPVHLVGILGGCIWATGTLLSFVTAGTAGAARLKSPRNRLLSPRVRRNMIY